MSTAKPKRTARQVAQARIAARLGASEEQPSVGQDVYVPTRRITIDLKASLHRRLRVAAAKQDQNMAEFLRSLIDRECSTGPHP
jgi:hypothetical protein